MRRPVDEHEQRIIHLPAFAVGDEAGTLVQARCDDRAQDCRACRGADRKTWEQLHTLATPTPQPDDGATYAKKIDKAEARIDWTRPASEIGRLVRAMNPAPGAWFEVDGTRIKILAGEISSARGAPGEVLDDRLTIACGEGAYRAITVLRAGKGAMAAPDMLRGTTIATGKRLEA